MIKYGGLVKRETTEEHDVFCVTVSDITQKELALLNMSRLFVGVRRFTELETGDMWKRKIVLKSFIPAHENRLLPFDLDPVISSVEFQQDASYGLWLPKILRVSVNGKLHKFRVVLAKNGISCHYEIVGPLDPRESDRTTNLP